MESGKWRVESERTIPRLFPDLIGDLVIDTRPQPQVSTGPCRLQIVRHLRSLRCG